MRKKLINTSSRCTSKHVSYSVLRMKKSVDYVFQLSEAPLKSFDHVLMLKLCCCHRLLALFPVATSLRLILAGFHIGDVQLLTFSYHWKQDKEGFPWQQYYFIVTNICHETFSVSFSTNNHTHFKFILRSKSIVLTFLITWYSIISLLIKGNIS